MSFIRSQKLLGVLFVVLISSLMMSACGFHAINSPLKNVEENGNHFPVKISIFHAKGMIVQGIIEEITEDFKKENPNIIVDFNASSKEYENIMKIKMASKNMPDVFSTHGWAIRRYGEFLADLSKEEWASRVKDSIKPIVMDHHGKLYVLPMDEDKTGLIFNANIFKKYAIKIPKTFDELMAACERIKEKSNGEIIPIHISGANPGSLGNFYDFFSTPLLISHERNDVQALLDGTFDWSKYNILSEKLLELKNKALINRDALTAQDEMTIEAFASEKVAIAAVSGPSIINEAKKLNPNLKVGIMPIPAMVEGDEPTFVGGERTTWGVWKDSPNIEAAKKYVAFFARAENIKKVAEANSVPPGLTDVDVDLGDLAPYYEQYKELRVFPYFDRAYLPNGMWEFMCRNAQDLFAGAITPQQYSQNMKEAYDRLRMRDK